MNKKTKTSLGVGVATAIAAILTTVLSVEGGYVNDPRDPGGETNHGVTVAVARENGYTGSMREMTRTDALDIYESKYVVGPNFDRIVDLSPAVGEEVIDSGVNAGPGRSARWFQTALNQLNANDSSCPRLQVDGVIGNQSIQAYSCLVRARGPVRACELTIKLLDAQQASHYMNLVNSDRKFGAFIVGWVDHRVGNVDLSKCR